MLEKLILAALVTLSLQLHFGWKWATQTQFRLSTPDSQSERVNVVASQVSPLN